MLANKYGITTYLKFLSIGIFCSIKFKLLLLSELPWILDNKNNRVVWLDIKLYFYSASGSVKMN